MQNTGDATPPIQLQISSAPHTRACCMRCCFWYQHHSTVRLTPACSPASGAQSLMHPSTSRSPSGPRSGVKKKGMAHEAAAAGCRQQGAEVGGTGGVTGRALRVRSTAHSCCKRCMPHRCPCDAVVKSSRQCTTRDAVQAFAGVPALLHRLLPAAHL
jgi:hypothetical protein